MTQDEIILMADASGLSFYGMGKDRDKFLHYLEAFATLVAAAKPWVGLTDEDMKDPKTQNFDFIYGARWAEAKLKERNT